MGYMWVLASLYLSLALPLSDVPPESHEASLRQLTAKDEPTFDASSKSYVLFLYDDPSCSGTKSAKCSLLEKSLLDTQASVGTEKRFEKFNPIDFVKINKEDFGTHKQDFEKLKVALPIVVLWPAGHMRPTCKLDSVNPSKEVVTEWIISKLSASQHVSLIQVNAEPTNEHTSQVCKVDEPASGDSVDDVTCSDASDQNLLQLHLERTQQQWNFSSQMETFVGPADNSLPNVISTQVGAPVINANLSIFSANTKKGMYQAIYFFSPSCRFCGCLPPVWQAVANNLVGSRRQPHLYVEKVDGDINPDLLQLFNITVFPTFIVVNKDGTKMLGRYLGPRKAFELSNWIEDMIVADNNEIVAHQFTISEQGLVPDLGAVYPYTGPTAFPVAPQNATGVALLD